MEKTKRDMWKIYINNDKNNEFPGFNTIEKDIIFLRFLIKNINLKQKMINLKKNI